MTHVVTALLYSAIAVGVLSTTANAQDNQSSATIDQVQLNDVWSDMRVEIPDFAWQATSTSTAVGNAAAGLVTSGSIDLDVQHNSMPMSPRQTRSWVEMLD